MEWLILAGLFEVAWAIGLKYSNGFSIFLPSFLTILCMIASFYFLALSLKSMPLGTAYAIWTGIGTVGTVILGIILFKEPLDLIRFACIVLVLAGVTGLKIFTT